MIAQGPKKPSEMPEGAEAGETREQVSLRAGQMDAVSGVLNPEVEFKHVRR
jgi:hypothetical protein